jgi:hypothetical protein
MQRQKPAMREWEKHVETNDREILLWDKVYPYSDNTGFLTRNTPVLDVDIIDQNACMLLFKLVQDLFSDDGELLLPSATRRNSPSRSGPTYPSRR